MSSRRDFLKGAAAASAATLIPTLAAGDDPVTELAYPTGTPAHPVDRLENAFRVQGHREGDLLYVSASERGHVNGLYAVSGGVAYRVNS